MGRGRKKAMATKIARELKYADSRTDLDRLQAELNVNRASEHDDEVDDLDEAGPHHGM